MIALDMILKILLNPKNQGSGRTKKKPSGKFPGRLFLGAPGTLILRI